MFIAIINKGWFLNSLRRRYNQRAILLKRKRRSTEEIKTYASILQGKGPSANAAGGRLENPVILLKKEAGLKKENE